MRYRRGWLVLCALAVLAPLGIIAAGGAWGEWDVDGIRERVGFAPRGMAETAAAPKTPFKDYTVPGLGGGFGRESLAAVVTAVLGAGATALIAWGVARIAKHGRIS
jgi:cobalt/nickel transport system permease protein